MLHNYVLHSNQQLSSKISVPWMLLIHVDCFPGCASERQRSCGVVLLDLFVSFRFKRELPSLSKLIPLITSMHRFISNLILYAECIAYDSWVVLLFIYPAAVGAGSEWKSCIICWTGVKDKVWNHEAIRFTWWSVHFFFSTAISLGSILLIGLHVEMQVTLGSQGLNEE